MTWLDRQTMARQKRMALRLRLVTSCTARKRILTLHTTPHRTAPHTPATGSPPRRALVAASMSAARRRRRRRRCPAVRCSFHPNAHQAHLGRAADSLDTDAGIGCSSPLQGPSSLLHPPPLASTNYP
ncbi:hypothetical protein ACJQWK_11441 [Exserohilum turcicum]